MSKLPHVKFVRAPLDLDASLIADFLESGWSKHIIDQYPPLLEASKEKDVRRRKEFVRTYLESVEARQKKRIQNSIRRFQRQWNTKEKPILEALHDIIGTDWPSNRRIIHAFVSLNPICPRFLDSWGFTTFYGTKSPKRVRRIATHEIAHFLHFKKWKELFPAADPKKFEQPHREWLISELAAVVVLNDPRLQRWIGERELPYPEHERLKVRGKSALYELEQIYQKATSSGLGYSSFCEKVSNLSIK